MTKRKTAEKINSEEAAAKAHDEGNQRKKKRFSLKSLSSALKSWLLLIFIAIITGYAFVTFLFQTVTVIGPSMMPTLKDNEVVIINKLDYRLHSIERYDVVAYKKVDSNGYYDIKRVYGLPGETVLIKDGRIYINGEVLEDRPVSEAILVTGIAANETVLGKDEYFVMGDNVNNSEDSRFSNIGNISSTEIKGKVVYVVSPKGDKRKVR